VNEPARRHNLLTPGDHPLELGDAVAALIVDETGRYLMQFRDDIPGIFYPDHWSTFGGGLEPGETDEQALRRELFEELQFKPTKVKPLQELIFNLADMGGGSYWRRYFEVKIASTDVDQFVLGEGREMRLLMADDILLRKRVTPYDSFAIWLHYAANNSIIQP
jgi:8-oxo-dGTP pyrophosphatase MutT (NUDIX family)